MKRTPPWVFVAAVGVQLAALCLVIWAMEHALPGENEPEAAASPPTEPEAPEPQAAPRAVWPEPQRPRASDDAAATAQTPPQTAWPEPVRRAQSSVPAAEPPATPQSAQPPLLA